MSRKKCKRKHWPLLNCIEHAIEGVSATPIDRINKLRLLELSAIESFAKGKATPDDWRLLADAVNIAQTMAEKGVGAEVLLVAQKADEALAQAHARFKDSKIGKLLLTGPELGAIRELYEFHDLQRTSITRGEYEDFIRATGNRIRGAHPSVKRFA